MGDFAIFTPEVAEALIARGFELVAVTDKAYYFTDSYWFRIAVEEILAQMVDQQLPGMQLSAFVGYFQKIFL